MLNLTTINKNPLIAFKSSSKPTQDSHERDPYSNLETSWDDAIAKESIVRGLLAAQGQLKIIPTKSDNNRKTSVKEIIFDDNNRAMTIDAKPYTGDIEKTINGTTIIKSYQNGILRQANVQIGDDKFESIYNEFEKVQEETRYDRDGNIIYNTMYDYDNSGKLKKITMNDGNGNKKEEEIYEHNENGELQNIIKTSFKNGEKILEKKYLCGHSNRRTMVESKFDNNELKSKNLYIYNKNGYLIKSIDLLQDNK